MSKQEITGRYVDVAGGRVHYDEMGEGQPAVLIHTLHSCSLEYRYLLPLLAQRGYHAIALDLPGNSRSYPPNWKPLDSPHAMAEFIWAFARKVCNGVKPVVSGCSIGGNLTIQLVAHHSAEILAGIAMEGGVYTPSLASLDDLRLPANFPAWNEWLERASTLSLNRKAKQELVQELLWTHRFTAHVTGVPESNCWTQQDLRGKVGKLHCPLLVLVGDEDFYLPPEFLELTKAEIPDCETRVLKGIGHYPMMEDPPLIAGIIDEFARRAQKR